MPAVLAATALLLPEPWALALAAYVSNKEKERAPAEHNQVCMV